jgi:hypothetical protein
MTVMRGLDPRIHRHRKKTRCEEDGLPGQAKVKPGNDGINFT